MYLHIVNMNLFQLTCVSHNAGISMNQNACYAGNRCIHNLVNTKFYSYIQFFLRIESIVNQGVMPYQFCLLTIENNVDNQKLQA